VRASAIAVDIAIVGILVPGLSAPTDEVTMSIGITHFLVVGSARGHRVHFRILICVATTVEALSCFSSFSSSDAAGAAITASTNTDFLMEG